MAVIHPVKPFREYVEGFSSQMLSAGPGLVADMSEDNCDILEMLNILQPSPSYE